MRRYVSYVVSTAALSRYRRHTATTTSEKEQPYCILCDAHLTAPLTADAWATHATTVSHHARTIIATSYCATAREKHIHDSLTRHFNLDFNEVEESAARRTARRRERLISSLEKVVQDGLLSQSIPIRGEDGELVVGDRFSIYATTGLSHVQCALFKQTAVLLPTVPARDLQVLIQYLTSTRCLSRMFDALQYDRLLTNNDGKRVTLRSEEKAAVLLATLGELALFDSRERKPHAVTDRSAASILVQHVLVSHALDTLSCRGVAHDAAAGGG
ncbi:RNA editing complex protein MP46 [Angomonas deanei]|uniref:Uncharacterized protein n=1 Tax=Angomonas deanei TaxID=59799 RepID=A0A7G2C7T2_9TRYP|nr:RNA editing complex protein MP46 [Angomonas deanei]CAD2215639.1 hypothetical protein, conserved [Angomonas deanei]|eukprot:EPY22826.1 RNA editing complex protein MP46 [Angomonas deanei]